MHIDLSAHAYLVRGVSRAHIEEILKAQNVQIVGNPDCMVREFDSLSIDEVRVLASWVYLKPVGIKKYMIVSADTITTEAQNALLKVVEEGSGKTTFFFLIPQGVSVLPTLESRCVVIKKTENKESEKEGKLFLSMAYQDRLALAEKFGKNHDRAGARILVQSLLAVAHSQKMEPIILRDILDADRYLKLSASSPKGIISHLALILP